MKRSILPVFLFLSLISSSLFSEATKPQDLLPAGVDAAENRNPFTGEIVFGRKGTVIATYTNLAALNQLLLTNQAEDLAEIETIKNVLLELLPAFAGVGQFDLFKPVEWISEAHEDLGRTYLTVLYLQMHPEKINASVHKKLQLVYEKTSSEVLRKEIQKLI